MALTIILSGPSANASQVRNSLTGGGFVVDPGDYNHGFAPSPEETWTGERDEDGAPIPGTGDWEPVIPDYPVSFVTCVGADLGKAQGIAKGYGFIIRSNYPAEAVRPVDHLPAGLELPKPDFQAQLDALQRQLDSLKGVL